MYDDGMEITIDEAERRLALLCGSLNVLHGQLVELVVDVIESGAWAVSGVRTVEHWLTWQAGLAPATARHLVSLATATATHPKVSALLADGAISLDQATAAVAAPSHCDDVMADLAPLSSVRQIRIEARVAIATVPDQDPAAADEGPIPATERVAQFFDEHGRYVLHAELDGERGRIVEAALAEAHDRGFRDGNQHLTWADALVDVATRSLAECSVGRLELFRINVFAESGGPVTWMDRAALPDAVRRQLACDGSWTPVVTDGGHPVSVARSQRIVPERTRRLVEPVIGTITADGWTSSATPTSPTASRSPGHRPVTSGGSDRRRRTARRPSRRTATGTRPASGSTGGHWSGCSRSRRQDDGTGRQHERGAPFHTRRSSPYPLDP